MFGKINIAKWIAREIRRTELGLLAAEDQRSEAQFRVKAMRERLNRLRARYEIIEAKERRAAPAVVPGNIFRYAPKSVRRAFVRKSS